MKTEAKGWALVQAGASGRERDVFDKSLRGIAEKAVWKATTYYVKKAYAVRRIFEHGGPPKPFNMIIAVTAIDEKELRNAFEQIATSVDKAGFSLVDGYLVILPLLYEFDHP